MDTKREQVRRIWHRCFGDSPEYEEMYFSEVYRDDDALILEHEGQAVASLMLQTYAMRFHADIHAPTGYICGAGTLPQWRNKGHMGTLMQQALTASRERGYIFTTLIPADRTLERYYSRFGFAPVFRTDRQRYTSLHTFRPGGIYVPYTDFDSDAAYRFFSSRMASRQCAILHNRRQYDNIIKDNSSDGGSIAGICDTGGNIRGMAFVVPRDSSAVVTDLLYTDTDTREATLAEVRRQYPGQPIEIMSTPDPQHPHHQPHGMLRIINPLAACRAIAEANPDARFSFRLNDLILPSNTGTYTISDGQAEHYPTSGKQPYTELDIGQLAAIIFGNKTTAGIFNFPSVIPSMSLMLD